MSSAPDEFRFDTAPFLSVSECVRAFRASARTRGKDPFEFGLLSEHELSRRRADIASGAAGSSGRKRRKALWSVGYLGVALLVIVGAGQDWWDSLAMLVGLVALVLSFVCILRPTLSGAVGKFFRGGLGAIFAIFLAGFGFLPSVRGTDAGELLGDFLNALVSVWVTLAVLTLLHVFAVEWRWRQREQRLREIDAQLSILRSALPLLQEPAAPSGPRAGRSLGVSWWRRHS